MADHKNNEVSVGPSMKSYFTEVTKAFDQYKTSNEFVTFHGPETHGHERLHSQFNLINTANNNAFKIKFNE